MPSSKGLLVFRVSGALDPHYRYIETILATKFAVDKESFCNMQDTSQLIFSHTIQGFGIMAAKRYLEQHFEKVELSK